ncbi:chain length determinant protein EpsF [Paucibacter sp. DJ2R-2]|uniref:chain length determinant protein EpsF n=1 Tax=Paucibacter sp. DJ2R-2 TaxID=2893558 RepID=UPI0021E36A67|nr:chain length determinant protein EpsF [Paucibacter sp. DJ2R-2]MCV2422822.1 chain length determinant protein EpsF [Paucibacter sp. DJ4R-1]MCV2441037.1 chain length determinant protein EpsF [Paucibacter sp. DJ2R-2]
MNFTQIFSILKARWVVGALVLGATLLATLVISLILPKQYLATASVVVDVKPDPISAMAYGSMVSPGFIATQVDIIQSERVAQRVVRNLKLTENPQIREQWKEATGGQGSLDAWIADSFQKYMDVKPSRESNVLSISYRAPDARFAAGLANAFVQAYVETSLELRVDPAREYSNFFDMRAKEGREAVEKAQNKLSAFQSEKGITAADERLDIENTRLNELSSQLVALQALASESSSRLNQAQSGSADKMQEVFNSPVVAGLKADVSRQEARLQEFNVKLGESHPQVVELKANLNELRDRLNLEVKRISGGVSVSYNINKQREAQVRSELAAQRAKVLQMKAVRDEGAVLVRDLENAQRAYDAITARRNQSSLESQTTQSSVNVLSQAVAPVLPASPKLVLNLVLSLFVGSMLALGTVMVMEMRDRRVRSQEDVSTLLGLPVIGVLPKPGARNLKALPNQMKQRVLGNSAL